MTAAAAPARLQAQAVGIRRGGLPRPAEASFTLRPGELALLLGPSGSGKSTLALALNGLIPHLVRAEVDGRVLVDGRDPSAAALHEITGDVFLVRQDPSAQIIAETAFDEVCFALENRLVPAADVEARAEDALRALDLWELRDRDARSFSGGQQQRLALACALASRCPVLVLDEPTANLSPNARRELYAALANLPGAAERAVLVIEHSVDDAIEHADRVIALDREGRSILDATPSAAFIEHEALLRQAGLWLPAARRASTRLLERGIALTPEPLTISELAEHLRQLDRAGWTLPAAPERPVAAAQAAVEVRGLAVEAPRGGGRLLDDIDLAIEAGTMMAIAGPTGAGKSTLLRAIAGLVAPAAGTVLVEGRPVRRRSRRAATGLVFQNPDHQLVEATVEEELAAAADAGLPHHERTARVDDLLGRLRLDGMRDRHPATLSGGEKRRLATGTALIAGHRVICFDEPTYGQDADSAEELLAELVRLRDEGSTIIIVAHDLQVIAEHADRLTIIDGGRLVDEGPVRTILAGDRIERSGLRRPPLAEAAAACSEASGLRGLLRIADLDRIEAPRAG